MGISYYYCRNCGNVMSNYDLILCENCGARLCSCSMPPELRNICNCWEDIWDYITLNNNNEIVVHPTALVDYSEVFKKYLKYNAQEDELCLKEEYCPLCQRTKIQAMDPEYVEYLRLKAKFEESI